MKTHVNIERAKALIESQPTGTVTPAMFIPWAVRAIQFLLVRYLMND